jgi:hypothetical protein
MPSFRITVLMMAAMSVAFGRNLYGAKKRLQVLSDNLVKMYLTIVLCQGTSLDVPNDTQ